MRCRTLARLILAALLCIQPGLASASQMLLMNFQGRVTIQKKGVTAWAGATRGYLLKIGDKIRTGPKGWAEVVSQEGHKILIKEGTTLEMGELGPKNWDFKQNSGKTRVSVKKIARGGSLKLRTPTAVCSVRGTVFETTVNEDKSTDLDVFDGKVGFGDPDNRFDDIIVGGGETSSLRQGEAPKPPEDIPEDRKNEGDQAKKQDKQDRQEEQRELKNEVNREINNDLNRDQQESNAVQEVQSNEYEQGRTLIDAFGQRVRSEQYITRPTPESFKYVSINTRQNRTDFSTFEVVANRELPQDIRDAGNLWFQLGGDKPRWHVVKQRWVVGNNDGDNIVRIDLDGDSMPVTFPERMFNENGQFQAIDGRPGWQTVFDHRYEFINGNPGAVDRMWDNADFRPLDNGLLSGTQVRGMMWHTRPVLVNLRNSDEVIARHWQDMYVTHDGNTNSTGKTVVVAFQPGGDDLRAHFRENRHYINFTDDNGNGILDQGEAFIDADNSGFYDNDELFYDHYAIGLSQTPLNGQDQFDDNVNVDSFFSDSNRDNVYDAGEPTGKGDSINNPWAFVRADNFVFNDAGQILNIRDEGFEDILSGPENPGLMGELFQRQNFQRVWHSTEFGERRIDVIIRPLLFLNSDQLVPQRSGERFLLPPPGSRYGPELPS